MPDGDVTPIVDADALRRAVSSAQDDVHIALRRLAGHIGRHGAGRLSVEERQESRTLDELGREVAELNAVQAASTDAQLLRRPELKQRADAIIRRVGELQAFAPVTPDHDVREDRLSAALNAMIDAIEGAERELANARPQEDHHRLPGGWIYDARLVSFGLAAFEGVFDALARWITRSQHAERGAAAHDAHPLGDAEAAAARMHLSAVPRRLRAASSAAQLAARRSSLVELKELLLEWPSTKMRIDDTVIEVWLLTTQPANGYGLRVDGVSYPDPFTAFGDAALVGVIAEAAGLDLSDLQQRRRAREHAERARRELAAIHAYRGSARRGDPNDAANCSDPSSPHIPDECRPDSREDLTDLLHDLADERWPITTALKDSLTAVCDLLGEGDRQRGLTTLFAHPDDDPAATALVRRLLFLEAPTSST